MCKHDVEPEYRITSWEDGDESFEIIDGFTSLRAALVARAAENAAQPRTRPPWYVQEIRGMGCGIVGWFNVDDNTYGPEGPEVKHHEIAAYLAERHGWTPDMIEEKLG